MLNDLRTALATFERDKVDFTVSSRDFKMNRGSLLCSKRKSMNISFDFTEHAFSQLCLKLGMPVRYMRKCFEEDTDLFDTHVNYWLFKAEESNVLFRTRGNTIRAILSDKYSILDNIEVFNALYSVMLDNAVVSPSGKHEKSKILLADRADLWDIRVKDFYMNEDYFQIRCVFPKIFYLGKRKKDPCYLGVNILNSETGCKKVTIEIVIWRQICSNGLIIAEKQEMLFSQRHLYVKKGDLPILFYDALGLAVENGNKYLEAFKASKELEYEDDEIKDTVSTILVGQPKEYIERVRLALEEPTTFGIINAITLTAQSLPFERRYEMERLAGSLL